ncbi:MAG: hypothetical protein AMXMBFR13_04480 [Phycisphaerae bacterium]
MTCSAPAPGLVPVTKAEADPSGWGKSVELAAGARTEATTAGLNSVTEPGLRPPPAGPSARAVFTNTANKTATPSPVAAKQCPRVPPLV